ncbi:hypothetical protein O0I10_003525 [Lichtheimia ornata]|uniref:Uncharacterized protein n=1 Tax=Lichtheimia ornata TaxID=688661 RepID=A0AAD7VB39_9FUNG|nr:uncharacterized protein O0I10_003525 [Lichtheimia ornata]KAJ8660881.1 hypothetical protein O0I10_003525 [Lichtheimia ornata]
MMDVLEHQLPSLRRIDVAFHDNVTSGGSRRGGGVLNQMQLLRALRYRCKHTDSLKELQLRLDMECCNKNDLAAILSNVMSIRTLETLAIRRTSGYECDDESDILAFVEGLQFSLPRLKHLELDSFCINSADVIDALSRVRRLGSLTLVNIKMKLDEATLLIKTMGSHLKDLYFVGGDLIDGYLYTGSLQTVARDYAPRCRLHMFYGYSGRYPN